MNNLSNQCFKIFFFTLFFLLTISGDFIDVFAAEPITGCQVSFSTTTLNKNSTSSLNVIITNNDVVQPIQWIKIVSPNSNVAINSGSADNFISTTVNNSIEFTGSSIDVASSLNFNLQLTIGSSDEGSGEPWNIFVSAQTDNSDDTLCSSSPTLTLADQSPTPTPQTITVTQTSTTTITNTVTAKDTTKPTIRLNNVSSSLSKSVPTISGVAQDNGGVDSLEYRIGEGGNWNSVPITKSNTVNFSFIPQGIRDGRSTIYVRAKDAAGNSASDDVSFSLDRTGPKITVETGLKKSYTTFPTIEGTATDPSGIQSIAYTLGGEEWTSIEEIRNSKFEIRNGVVDDGEYPMQIRATDKVGNISITKPQTLVIDRLPPQIGASVLVYAFQPLTVLSDETYHTLPFQPHTITVSVIGGPTSVELQINDRVIPLSKKQETNLWEGELQFVESNVHTLSLRATDAQATVELDIPDVTVVPVGSVNISNAMVSLYVLDEKTGEFVLWNSKPYGQENPIEKFEIRNSKFEKENQVTTQPLNQLAFLPPKGTYYVRVTGKGISGISSAFTLQEMQPVVPTINLTPKPWFLVPFLRPDAIPAPPVLIEQQYVSKRIAFPTITLQTGDEALSPLTVEGKETVIAMMNTWLPQTPSLLRTIDQYRNDHPQKRIFVLFPHESNQTVSLFQTRGGYTVPMIADPDGQLLSVYPLTTSHTFLHLDTTGGLIKQSLEL